MIKVNVLEKCETDACRFTEELRGSHHHQKDLTLYLWRGNVLVGHLDYSVFEDIPSVQYVFVESNCRRQGLGRALLKEMQRRHPGVEIELGLSTEDGAKLINSLTFVVLPTKHSKHFSVLEGLRAERQRLQLWADEWHANNMKPLLADKIACQKFQELNDINSKIWALEQMLQDKKATTRLIVTR